MTEDEAKKLWCPLTFSRQNDVLTCCGKRCMAFIQLKDEWIQNDDGKDGRYMERFKCGMIPND